MRAVIELMITNQLKQLNFHAGNEEDAMKAKKRALPLCCSWRVYQARYAD